MVDFEALRKLLIEKIFDGVIIPVSENALVNEEF